MKCLLLGVFFSYYFFIQLLNVINVINLLETSQFVSQYMFPAYYIRMKSLYIEEYAETGKKNLNQIFSGLQEIWASMQRSPAPWTVLIFTFVLVYIWLLVMSVRNCVKANNTRGYQLVKPNVIHNNWYNISMCIFGGLSIIATVSSLLTFLLTDSP